MITRNQDRAVAATMLVMLAGCTASARVAQEAIEPKAITRVVAVEAVYGDLARQLGGNTVDVTTILNGASADPHSYEPGARDADAIAAADIVIENGLGYDAFADKLLAASPRPGREVLNAGALGGHKIGDNPHVWYELSTLRRLTDAIAIALEERRPASRAAIERHRGMLATWLSGVSARLRALRRRRAGTAVAITEPVFNYVLQAARLRIATPESFSQAIEEGSDPSPQDIDTMRDLIGARRVAAFVYNRQAIEPTTAHLLDLAHSVKLNVVTVTETLPAHEMTQGWIDGEIMSLERAL